MIGVGTRYSDFTTASRTVVRRPRRPVRQPQRRRRSTPHKHAGDAAGRRRPRGARGADATALAGWRAPTSIPSAQPRRWHARLGRRPSSAPTTLGHEPLPGPDRGASARSTTSPSPRDVVVCAAGSHARRPAQAVAGPRPASSTTSSTATPAWATRSPAALGVKLAAPDREVFVAGRRRLLPDDAAGDRHRRAGGHQAHRGARAEPRLRLDRRAVGVGRARSGSAPRYRYRDPATGLLDGDVLPVDLAANAASLGADVHPGRRRSTSSETALATARAADRTTVVHVETDPLAPGPGSRGLVGRAGGRGRRTRHAPGRPATTYEAQQAQTSAAT